MIRNPLMRGKIDRTQFRMLLKISLVNEWREQHQTRKKKRRIPVFFRSLIFYLIMGFSLGASLVTRTTPQLYTFFCYAYFMMMTGMAVILECSQVLMIPEDLDILSHRPVSSPTLFWARIAHMLVFVLFFCIVLCVGPAVISLFLPGAPHAFPLTFSGIALLAVLFTAALTLLFYSALIRQMRFEKLKSLVTGIQFFMILILVFLYQWIARTGWETDGMQFQIRESWMRWMPPGWFAAVTDAVYRPESLRMFALSIPVLAAVLSILIIAFHHLSLHYLQDAAGQDAAAPEMRKRGRSRKRETIKGRLSDRIRIRDPEFRAGLFLAIHLLRRDRSVKLTLLPMLAMPSVILIWGIIESDIADPFVMPAFGSGAGSMQMLPFFIVFLIFMTLNGSAFIKDWEARWIYLSAPLESPARFRRGVRAGLFLAIVIPFYLLLLLVFCTQFSWVHAVQHTVYLLLLGLLFLSLMSFRRQAFPFSRKRERGERIGGLAFFMLLIPFQIAAVFVHLFAYQNQSSWFLSAALLLLIRVVLDQWSHRRQRRMRDLSEIFE